MLIGCDTEDLGDQSAKEEELFTAINNFRSQNSLEPLKSERYLSIEARIQSQEMALGQIRYSGFRAAGYDELVIRINQELGTGEVEDIHQKGAFVISEVTTAWTTNIRQKNILLGQFTHGGTGIYQNEEGESYYSFILFNKKE